MTSVKGEVTDLSLVDTEDDETEGFSERFKQALRAMSDDKSVAATGRSVRQLKRYASGSELPFSVLRAVARGANVSVQWLAVGDAQTNNDVRMEIECLRRKERQYERDLSEVINEEGRDHFKSLLAATRDLILLNQEKLRLDLDKLKRMPMSPRPAPASRQAQMVSVPRFDVAASAGRGALVVSEDVSEHMSVGREWLRRHLPPWAPPNAVVGVLEGAGDSMEPTIRDGDLLMLVRDADWKIVGRGGIFVFSLDGHLLLKRLQVMRDGSLRIISDNPAYETEVIPKAELESSGIIIHGEVFFVGGKPRSYVSAPASGPPSTIR